MSDAAKSTQLFNLFTSRATSKLVTTTLHRINHAVIILHNFSMHIGFPSDRELHYVLFSQESVKCLLYDVYAIIKLCGCIYAKKYNPTGMLIKHRCLIIKSPK